MFLVINQVKELAKKKIRKDFSLLFFYVIIKNDNRRGSDMLLAKRNGQALVEFVILLPVFIFMLFSMLDFGKILYVKNNLESKMDDVITEYKNENTLEEIDKKLDLTHDHIFLEITKDETNETLFLKKEIAVITPGLNMILKNPYVATAKRVIDNE